MNLISETHHSCKMRKYAFMILWNYIIIIQKVSGCQSVFKCSINSNNSLPILRAFQESYKSLLLYDKIIAFFFYFVVENDKHNFGCLKIGQNHES